MKIIDISRGIMKAPVYPGDPKPELTKISDISQGNEYNVSVLKACVHAATHIDSPSHCFPEGESIEQLALEKYIGKCKVISIDTEMKGENIGEIDMGDKNILLIKGSFLLDKKNCEKIIAKGVSTIGTEMDTIGDNEIHRFLLQKNIGIIEHLDLINVSEGEYFLFAPPIKIEGSDGAFTRAVLITF